MSKKSKNKRRPGKKKLLSAAQYSDFRPLLDLVIRDGDRCFIIDTQGEYAPHEVSNDALQPEFIENFQRLNAEQQAQMVNAIALSPYLSWEGKKERFLAIGVPFVDTQILVEVKESAELPSPRLQIARPCPPQIKMTYPQD